MGFIVSIDLGQKQDYSAVVVLERPLWCPKDWANEAYAIDPVEQARRQYFGVEDGDQDIQQIDFGVEDDWLYQSSLSKKMADQAGKLLRYGPSNAAWPANIIHVDRWRKFTPYPDIVEDAVKITQALLAGTSNVNLSIVVDATGVGRPVVDMLKDRLRRSELDILHSLYACTITGGTNVNWETSRDVSVPKRDLVMSAVTMLENDRLRWPEAKLEMIAVMESELRNFQQKYSKAGNEMFEAERKDHDDLVLALAMATWLATQGRGLNRPEVLFL